MPLGPARRGRVGVVGAPVAKTAVVAAAVSPGPSPVSEDRGGGRCRDSRTSPPYLAGT